MVGGRGCGGEILWLVVAEVFESGVWMSANCIVVNVVVVVLTTVRIV